MTKLNVRSLIHLGLGLLSICIVVAAFAIPTYAYTLAPHKLPSKVASYTWGSNLQTSNSVIRNGFENAIDDWYDASSVVFYYSSSSNNTLNSIYESSSSLYGRATITSSNGIVTKFTATVNAGNSYISNNNVARSAANHELGHVLGLDDKTSGIAIMNTNRNREITYVPKADDIDGVAAIYD